MRVLVTGAAGFIGSNLCEALINAGHEVVGLDNFSPAYAREIKESNLQVLRDTPGFVFHERDLLDECLTSVLDGVDAVIHEAGLTGLVESWAELETYLRNNVVGTQRLLDACREVGVQRFIHASTSSVYGVEAVGAEAQPVQPVSPYGITKLASEHLVLSYVRAFDFPAVILRYFSVYGPRQRPDMAYHRFIEAMLDQQPITVYGDGRQSRSGTYISDCVAGTLGALEHAREGEIYNIGGGESIALIDAIGIIAAALGIEPDIQYEPGRLGDQRHTRADCSKASKHFGYAPQVAPSDGLPLQVDWHRSRRS